MHRREQLRRRIILLTGLLDVQKILIMHRRLKQKKRQHKRYWVQQIFRYRDQLDAFNTLFKELKDDREYFFRYLRMSPDRFGHLLSLV